MKPVVSLGADNTISMTVENFQIVGDDTLRLDLSFDATIHQDGKELKLDHERQTIYVNKKRTVLNAPVSEVLRHLDQRRKGSI